MRGSMSSVMSQMVQIQLHRFDEVAPFVDEKQASVTFNLGPTRS